MNEKLLNKNIEEVLIRLLTLEWYLDTLIINDKGLIKELISIFKKEIEESLKFLEKYYVGISIPGRKVLKNKKKAFRGYRFDPVPVPLMPSKPKKGIKNARSHNKRKTKKSTKNKKSKK